MKQKRITKKRPINMITGFVADKITKKTVVNLTPIKCRGIRVEDDYDADVFMQLYNSRPLY